jgi:lipopolysaccharide export system ATP-binding protein
MEAGTQAAPAECGGSTLVVKGLQKSYGKRLVVRDVSLQVACGEVVGLLGPNGAGKTTSFYMIVGLVPSDAGSIDINGTDITSLPIHRRALLGLSYLPQEASVFRKLTVEENIRAVLELQRENGKSLTKARITERLDELLTELQIEKLRESPALSLSGGERRRVEIAMALAQKPKVLLLDEPYAGLSIDERRDVQALLKTIPRDVTVVMIEHNMDVALEFADRISVMHFGEMIVEGTRAEVVADPRTKEVYLGH